MEKEYSLFNLTERKTIDTYPTLNEALNHYIILNDFYYDTIIIRNLTGKILQPIINAYLLLLKWSYKEDNELYHNLIN